MPVKQSEMPEELKLWEEEQREAYRNGTLLPERYEKLKAIGFDFEPKRRKK